MCTPWILWIKILAAMASGQRQWLTAISRLARPGLFGAVLTLACSRETSCNPKAAVSEKKAMGDQQRKSVNTSRAMRFAIRESFEFHAWTIT